MDRLKNKKVFITPYSPITRRLEKYLIKHYNITSLGFIDKSKIEKNINNLSVLNHTSFDYIVIFSPAHFKEIYKECLKKTTKEKIFKIDFLNDNYSIFNKNEIFIKNFKKNILSKVDSFKKNILRFISKTIDVLKIERNLILFISENYVDANIKHLYLYYLLQHKNVLLLTNNKNQIKELNQNNLPVKKLFSFAGYVKTAFAKEIYLDHFILDYLEYTSIQQTKIQIWHGVGLKPIRDRSHFEYDYFISTSHWTNETNFQKVFKAKQFTNSGYPRNDIFFKEKIEKNDLIFCDMNIYNKILEDKKNGIKAILYMPTFRENGFDTFALNLDSFNKELADLSVKFYIKLHPYDLNPYIKSIEIDKEYSNIIFYNTQGDIYPIVKNIDILVTDYSSVAYDFLLLDKPIIFFNYDYEEYIEIREESIGNKFLFNYYDYTPGAKVQIQDKLIDEIKNLLQNKDLYINQRKKIRDNFFNNIDNKSCERILNLIKV
jgi:CDP-glycerol glycerophosphotransferase (TagB/SpsB family)